VNSRQLKGLAVLSIDDGEQIGTIARTYVDGEQKRIAGFAFAAAGGFMEAESEPKVDVEEVRSLGPDVLTVEKGQDVRGASINQRYSSLLVLDDLTHRPVLSESGTAVGQVASIEFDPRSFALTRIEVSPGYFKHNQTIPIDQVAAIGPDYVIVDDSVCQPGAAVAAGTETGRG
jgi:sporulation protein YlmC with PRC-barrel domain